MKGDLRPEMRLKRIKLPPRPKCSRCSRRPCMVNHNLCISCRDMLRHGVDLIRPEFAYLDAPKQTRRRHRGEREDIGQTKHGVED